jgi:hypothetical protein
MFDKTAFWRFYLLFSKLLSYLSISPGNRKLNKSRNRSVCFGLNFGEWIIWSASCYLKWVGNYSLHWLNVKIKYSAIRKPSILLLLLQTTICTEIWQIQRRALFPLLFFMTLCEMFNIPGSELPNYR